MRNTQEQCPIGNQLVPTGDKNPCDPSLGIKGCIRFCEAVRQAGCGVGTGPNQFPNENSLDKAVRGYVNDAINNGCLFARDPQMTVNNIINSSADSSTR